MDTLRGTVVNVDGPRTAELQVTQIGGTGNYRRREQVCIEALCDVDRDLEALPQTAEALAEIILQQRVRCFVRERNPDGSLTVQLQVL